jgi:alpha-1,2-mannosyltransferase
VKPVPARALLGVGAGAFALTIGLYVVYGVIHPASWTLDPVDLAVYRSGGLIVRQVRPDFNPAVYAPLYQWGGYGGLGLKFTYTPFAAIVFALISFIPWSVLPKLSMAVNVAALVAALWFTFRGLGYPGRARAAATLLASAAVFWTEPVVRTLYLGQVNLVLMALIIWDLTQPDTARSRWWKGAGVGIAAGIKLVPLVFIPYLLLARKFRQAAMATAGFGFTVAVGFIIGRHDSVKWWFGGLFFQGGRTGFTGWEGNQSLRGLITRLAGSVAAGAPASLWIAALMGVIGVLAAAVLHQSGRPVYGWVLCALTGLLVSPISWDHHWVWMVPALVAFVDTAVRSGRARRWAAWAAAGAVLAVFADWPGQVPGDGSLVPRGVLPLVYGPGEHPYGQLYHWHGSELILGNAYVLAGLVLFGALAVTARHARRSPARPPGRPAAGRVPAARPAGVDPELIPGMSRN